MLQHAALRRPVPKLIEDGTFAAVIRAFQRTEVYNSHAAETRRSWGRLFRLAEDPDNLGAVPVDSLRPALVQAFLDGLASSPSTQAVAKTALKQVEKWAVVREHVPYPFMTGTSHSYDKEENGHEPWPEDMVDLAIQHARPDLARAILLAVETGQRGSDTVKMRWNDVTMVGGHRGINVRQKKTGKRLWIPFTDRLNAVYDTWQKTMPPFIVLREDGTPYGNRQALSQQWIRERETNEALRPIAEAGYKLHGLRGTAVVRARKLGATELMIANIFGMSEPMVARYSRLAAQGEMALAALHFINGNKGAQATKNVARTQAS